MIEMVAFRKAVVYNAYYTMLTRSTYVERGIDKLVPTTI